MSVMPPKAEVETRGADVRYVPIGDIGLPKHGVSTRELIRGCYSKSTLGVNRACYHFVNEFCVGNPMSKNLLAVATSILFSASAFAADLPRDVAITAPLVDETGGHDWSGFYLGLHAGYSSLDPNSPDISLIQPDSDGFSGGGHVGFNYMLSEMFLLGIEGDFSFTDLDATALCDNPIWDCNAGADWTATIRARAGVHYNNLLIYATGGAAFIDYNGYTQDGGFFPDSETLTGWTAGGGVEFAWGNNLIFGVEALYMDFESANMQYDLPYPVEPDLWTVRGRVSYMFGGM